MDKNIEKLEIFDYSTVYKKVVNFLLLAIGNISVIITFILYINITTELESNETLKPYLPLVSFIYAIIITLLNLVYAEVSLKVIEIENHNSASWLLSGRSQTAESHRPCMHAGYMHCLRRRERRAAPGQRLPPQAPPHAARQLRHRDRARLRREGRVGAGVGGIRSAIRRARGWSGDGHAATSARGGPLPQPQPQHQEQVTGT